MVLDEDALEAMLARGQAQSAEPAEMVTTDENDEFEVYERKAEPEPEPEPEIPTAEPVEVEDEFEVFERKPRTEPAPPAPAAIPEPEPPVPEPAPVAAPEPEPAPAEAVKRRPEVWPPIQRRDPAPVRSHAPEPQAAAPASKAQGARIAIVQATFNIELTDTMAKLARDKAAELGAEVIATEQCAGVYDLPLPTKRLLARDDVDGVVVIGVVVQGETKHDEIITHATAKTLQELSLQFDKPVGLAVTGPGMTWVQAEARVANAAHGVEAVLALLRL
ncbi:MAG: 6,7-dimethyl-8-ribityllumazine synthase [Thermoplasmatota archaeon]